MASPPDLATFELDAEVLRRARTAYPLLRDENLELVRRELERVRRVRFDLPDPAEPAGIDVPAGDPWFDPTGTGAVTISLNRSIYDHKTGASIQIECQRSRLRPSMAPLCSSTRCWSSSARR